MYQNREMSVETASLDPLIVNMYEPYKEKLDREMNQVIGFTHTDLLKGKPESKLTNLLADLLLEESWSSGKKAGMQTNADMAFLNYGGIRTGLSQGEITVRKIFELMPFENELVIIELSATDVQAFLDLIASRGGDSLSGVRFRIRDGKAVEIIIGGELLDSRKKYWLATSDYVADGGDSYAMLQNNSRRINTEEKIRDVMIRYFERTHAAGKVIQPETDGRIVNE